MKLSEAQVKTQLSDAIGRLVKGKSVIVDGETWELIREGVVDWVNGINLDHHLGTNEFAKLEITRLDKLFSA